MTTPNGTTDRLSPAAKFEAFHAANPRVYALLVMLVREFRRETGRETVGFSLIYGAARWKWAIETRDETAAYKLNNDYAPFYARMIMGEMAGLSQAFHLRRSVADEWAVSLGYPAAMGFWDEEINLVERHNSRGEVVLEQVSA